MKHISDTELKELLNQAIRIQKASGSGVLLSAGVLESIATELLAARNKESKDKKTKRK